MERSPLTLLELLSTYSVVLQHLSPYLPVHSLHALARTSKDFYALVYQNAAETFRYLDLSQVKSASLAYKPLDSGGVNWRSQRMDEALTEDEFYSGPLRGIFSKLSRRHVLEHVQILILDGLSVPTDLVQQIVTQDRFNVRVLSLREAKHLNERKLTQLLQYIVRPTRPPNTPRLRALYIFQLNGIDGVYRGFTATQRIGHDTRGVTESEGAQIGATWNQKSHAALNIALTRSEDLWYQPTGKMFKKPLPEWGPALKACEGIIAFDAVLCRGPRHDVDTCPRPQTRLLLEPAVASVALGPAGCVQCASCPEGPAMYGRSPSSHLPILGPPPLHSTSVRAAQFPFPYSDGDSFSSASPPPSNDDDASSASSDGSITATNQKQPSLIVRCEDCLQGRWCERCNRWWDEDCYEILTQETSSQQGSTGLQPAGIEISKKIKMKTFQDCVGCGPTCEDCKAVNNRQCIRCRSHFCVICNEGSTATACDWCSRRGRLRRELY